MKIILEQKEAEEIFHSALCGVHGSNWWGGYGLEFKFDRPTYKATSERMKKELDSHVCHEDVLLQILKDGGSIQVEDFECDGEYNRTITMKEVIENLQLADPTRLLEVKEGTGDIDSDDCVLQTIFFGEVIFG